MRGRLNSFQRTMLQWNDLHPYNAVHVVRFPGPVAAAELQAALDRTLTTHGLTGLALDRRAGTYEYHGGPARCALATLPAGADPEATLAAEIQRQLNTPFALAGRFTPFRFFLVPTAPGPALGVAYFHAVAGAESLVLLLRDIVHGGGSSSGPGLVPPVELHPSAQRGWLARHPGVLVKKLLSLPALWQEMRRAARPKYYDPLDPTNGFTSLTLPPAVLRGLTATGKAWGVTLNDLFLAALLQALIPLAEAARRHPRRQRLALGCIVNIRSHLGVDSRRTFGLFLGSFLVSHEAPAGSSLQTLATDIQRQTARIKRDRRFMATPVDTALARAGCACLSSERRMKFFPKHYPLWGGVTNMNLNPLWPQPAGSPPVDYLRAVSTGPVTPLVLSLTTVRDVVNLGLTYRTAVYRPADIAAVQAGFLRAVGEASSLS